VAASLGALPQTARVAPLATMLQKYESDPITIDAAISGLAGLENEVLELLLQGTAGAPRPAGALGAGPSGSDAVTTLAATITRGRNVAAAEKLLAIATDEKRPMWQRLAVLRGTEAGLDGGGGRGGGGGGGARGGGRGAGPGGLTFPQEPTALLVLANGTDELASVARSLAARVNWPGKPAPVVDVVPLTPEQQKRFAQGQEVYNNLCVACHQPDGQGREKIAPSLVNSRYVVAADAGLSTRIVLAGKEGPVGLMPPLGASLSDEQIAGVLTYIRREWGHTASPVAPADVKEIRGMTASRNRPWTEDEISRMTGRGGGGRGRGGQ
jgi:mono/diheme cytochrome c family protein